MGGDTELVGGVGRQLFLQDVLPSAVDLCSCSEMLNLFSDDAIGEDNPGLAMIGLAFDPVGRDLTTVDCSVGPDNGAGSSGQGKSSSDEQVSAGKDNVLAAGSKFVAVFLPSGKIE